MPTFLAFGRLMPRIRSLKPDFFSDEKMAPLPVITRFVFMGLISMADDAGRVIDNVKIIDAFIFPETSETSRGSLDDLSAMKRIRRGVTSSGQRIIEIVNWNRHQKIEKANLARALPPIETEVEQSQDVASIPRRVGEMSGKCRGGVGEALPDASGTDRDREGDREKEKEKEQQPRMGARAMAAAAADPPSTHEQLTADALALTIAANQAITAKYGEQPSPIIATAGASLRLARELRDAGIPVAFAVGAIVDVVTRSDFERPPRTLGYFRGGIHDRWAADQAHKQARRAPASAPVNGSPDVPAVVEYTPDVIRRRAEFFEWLCNERTWNQSTPEYRQNDLQWLKRQGYVPDEARFLAEWQLLKPLADGDLYRERTRGQVIALFADSLTAALAPAPAEATS